MSDLYLIHSAKGSQRANHKYIDRVWRKGRWQYIYRPNIGTNNRYDRDKSGQTIYKNGKFVSTRSGYANATGMTKISAIRKSLKENINSKRAYDAFPKSSSREITRDAKNLRTAKEESLKSKFYNSNAGKALIKTVAKANEKKREKHTQDLLNSGKKYEIKRTVEKLSKNNKPTTSPQEKAKQITEQRNRIIKQNPNISTKTTSPQQKAKQTTAIQKVKEREVARNNAKLSSKSSKYIEGIKRSDPDRWERMLANADKADLRKWYPDASEEYIDALYSNTRKNRW